MNKVDIGAIDTLVLCGGKGTRLKSIVPDKPKILADIGGSPFIKYLLDYFEEEGLTRIILCTGCKHNLIEEWVRSSYNGNIKIILSREKQSMGTAGAIKNAQKYIISENFIVVNGDTLTNISIRDFMKYYYKKKALCLLGLSKSDCKINYGSVIIDKDNKIVNYSEKSSDISVKDEYISIGLYLFKKKLLNYIPNNLVFSMEYDLFPLLRKSATIVLSFLLYSLYSIIPAFFFFITIKYFSTTSLPFSGGNHISFILFPWTCVIKSIFSGVSYVLLSALLLTISNIILILYLHTGIYILMFYLNLCFYCRISNYPKHLIM